MFRLVNPISADDMAMSHNIFRFSRVVTLLVWVVLLSGAMVHGAIAIPVVDSVRIGDYAKKTRFVIELDKTVKFNVYTLGNPYRVVIELPEVIWRIKANAIRGGRRISGYRFGLFRPGHSRVVIDLKSPMKVTNFFSLS